MQPAATAATAMTASAANIGGATQAETMSADSAPIAATPHKVPARCELLASVSRVCSAEGSCSVKSSAPSAVIRIGATTCLRRDSRR